MCDHLLEFKTWRHDDPKPLRGISYATATRHLRILRKRLGKLMGKSARKGDPPWPDLPKQQWDLLWQGETMWKKYGARIWDAGHKTVALFRGASTTPLHTILRVAGDTSVPEPGGLEAHPGGGPSGRCQRLGYLLRIHPVAGATGGQSHPVARSGRANKKTHLRTIQPDIAGRTGGS